MKALWKHYDKTYEAYEHNFPLAFPWNEEKKEDLPRFVLGEDGYWFDPSSAETGKALLSCMGDLMCEPMMTQAHQFSDRYFFHPLFQFVRPILKGSDFTVANLETLLGDASPYAGLYHRVNRKFHCNGPECYLEALRYAGFDALVTANNHNCDAGITGLFETLSALDRHGFPHTGSFHPEDGERVLFVKICGIRVAILSYGSRYNSLDEINFTEEGIETVLNYFSKEKIDCDVAHARERGAEFILCYIHWGRDYDEVPNEQQLSILEEMKEADVDYIVGSHTHCLQAANLAVSKKGKEIPMIFSMGNFVTNESRELCKHTAILQLSLERGKNGISVEEALIPCYVYDEFFGSRYGVVPAQSTLNGGFGGEKMEEIKSYVRERVGERIPFLAAGETDLSALCRAMELPVPEGLEKVPVTSVSAEVGQSTRGGLYFSVGGENPYQIKELCRRKPTAVICREPFPELPAVETPPYIITDDVEAAFAKACLAAKQAGSKPKTLLVAGRSGKTLTAALCERVLKTSFRTYSPADEIHYDIAPWQKIHPKCEWLVTELRDSYPLGEEMLPSILSPDAAVLTGTTPSLSAIFSALPDGAPVFVNAEDEALLASLEKRDTERLSLILCDSRGEAPFFPFADQNFSAVAALALGSFLGLEEKACRKVVSSFALPPLPRNDVEADGVRLLLNLNCKELRSLSASLDAFGERAGRGLCVFGDTSAATRSCLYQKARETGAEHIFFLGEGEEVEGALCAKTERELEKAILSVLRDGDCVLFLGDRPSNLSITVRRLFGLCDICIPNSEYYTGDEPLVL